MKMRTGLLCVVATLVLAPSPLIAQSSFGVIGGVGLPSDVQDKFAEFILNSESVDASSRDFEIGVIVRGRHLGGDWGVSFIQKTYEDGSALQSSDEVCFNGQCQSGSKIMRNVKLRGMFIHKFVPFVTIRDRVQIGLNFGGGFGQASGTADNHEFDFQVGPPPNRPVQLIETVSVIDAKELFLEGRDYLPLWKVEAMAAVLVAPGLKVRVGGGMNFMNYPAISIGASYLFTSR
jgi:hypothetical protein